MNCLTAATNTSEEEPFPDWLGRVQAAVGDRLQTILAQPFACPTLAAAMRDSVLNGGQRLRPAILLAVAGHPRPPAALDAACALELIHCYSLIHDDMPCMDNDDTRRGQPACHKIYGDGMAMLAGDCLQTLAFETLAASGLPATAITRLAAAAGANGMGGGQALDIGGNITHEEPQMETMHLLKTGALFDCALQLGLMCRRDGDDERLKAAAAEFAPAFGLLFQIANDLQDETQDQAAGKITYVTLLSREQAAERARAARQRALAAAAPFPRLADITCRVYHG